MKVQEIKIDDKTYTPTKQNNKYQDDECKGCCFKNKAICKQIYKICVRMPQTKVWELKSK